MKNLTNSTSNTGINLAAVLLFKMTTPVILKKPLNQIYYVDDCQIEGDNINVSYTLNDDWAEITISLSDLKSFAVTVGLNDYCFDRSVNGEHVQESGSYDLDTFIGENLNTAVAAYLRSKRIGQNVN